MLGALSYARRAVLFKSGGFSLAKMFSTEMPKDRILSYRTGNKVFFFNQESNDGGQFINLTEAYRRGGSNNHDRHRTTVIIPVESLLEVARNLSELHAEMSKVSDKGGELSPAKMFSTEKPKDRILSYRMGNRAFFFNPESNDGGQFIRLTEAYRSGQDRYRNTVVIPVVSLLEVARNLSELHAEVSKVSDTVVVGQKIVENVSRPFNETLKSPPRSRGNEPYRNEGKRQIPFPKYMPPTKTAEELFQEEHIEGGPLFDELFGQQQDSKAYVCGGEPGDEVPAYYDSFDECEFDQQIMTNLKTRKWRHLTQIQKAVLPLIVERKNDILALAQTGSGKTASFMLPLIDKIHKQKVRNGLQRKMPGSKPHAIVVTRTRELAHQMFNEARMFAEGTLVTVVESYGEIPMMQNLRDIREGCDILVITVGRLEHFQRDEHINLCETRYLILDEVDKLMDGKYFEKLFTIKQHMSENVRTLAFSAMTLTEEKDKLLTRIFGEHNIFTWTCQPNEKKANALVRVTRKPH